MQSFCPLCLQPMRSEVREPTRSPSSGAALPFSPPPSRGLSGAETGFVIEPWRRQRRRMMLAALRSLLPGGDDGASAEEHILRERPKAKIPKAVDAARQVRATKPMQVCDIRPSCRSDGNT